MVFEFMRESVIMSTAHDLPWYNRVLRGRVVADDLSGLKPEAKG